MRRMNQQHSHRSQNLFPKITKTPEKKQRLVDNQRVAVYLFCRIGSEIVQITPEVHSL